MARRRARGGEGVIPARTEVEGFRLEPVDEALGVRGLFFQKVIAIRGQGRIGFGEEREFASAFHDAGWGHFAKFSAHDGAQRIDARDAIGPGGGNEPGIGADGDIVHAAGMAREEEGHVVEIAAQSRARLLPDDRESVGANGDEEAAVGLPIRAR